MTVVSVISWAMVDALGQFELDGDIIVILKRLDSTMRQNGMSGKPHGFASEPSSSEGFDPQPAPDALTAITPPNTRRQVTD